MHAVAKEWNKINTVLNYGKLKNKTNSISKRKDSKGETFIKEFLEKYNINFTSQYGIDVKIKTRNTTRLIVDFYIKIEENYFKRNSR